MVKRSRIVAALLFLAAVQPAGARADAPPPARLEAAKDFFRQGNAELAAGHYDRALDLFLQSRAQVPSVANTNNAALSLEKLGRIDEALDLYEELLVTFASQLSSDERAAVSTKAAALGRQVGRLQIAANIDGTLIVDGRRRGTVPMTTPLRVPAGPHLVRVIRDGYAPAEATVVTRPGELAVVDLRLEALAATGRLRVIDQSGATGLEVLIDGAPIGVTPWEGTLGPGAHVVALRGPDVGSMPQAATVVVGQTSSVTLRSEPLGPPLSLFTEPPTATLRLDGVELGRGPWRGRLPRGEHVFEVRDEAYLPATVRLGADQTQASVALAIDDQHPRWRTSGRWRLDALGGAAFGASLGSSGESSCEGGCAAGSSGWLGALRVSYRFPVGLSVEASAGLLQLGRDFQRQRAEGDITYRVSDSLRLRGPFAALGVGYRRPLNRTIAAVARFSVGALFARTTDPVQVSASLPGRSPVAMVVDQGGGAVRSTAVFLMPALGADITLGHKMVLGLGVAAGIFLSDGPRLPHGETTPGPGQSCTAPSSASDPVCARASSALAGERAFSSFVTWIPQISLGREFLACCRGSWRCPPSSAARPTRCPWPCVRPCSCRPPPAAPRPGRPSCRPTPRSSVASAARSSRCPTAAPC